MRRLSTFAERIYAPSTVQLDERALTRLEKIKVVEEKLKRFPPEIAKSLRIRLSQVKSSSEHQLHFPKRKLFHKNEITADSTRSIIEKVEFSFRLQNVIGNDVNKKYPEKVVKLTRVLEAYRMACFELITDSKDFEILSEMKDISSSPLEKERLIYYRNTQNDKVEMIKHFQEYIRTFYPENPWLNRLNMESVMNKLTKFSLKPSQGSELLLKEKEISDVTFEDLGKYVTIGPYLFESEIPRRFERTEWSVRMLRGPEKETDPEWLKQQVERLKKSKDISSKFDTLPIVNSQNMQIMVREGALNLVEEMKKVQKDKTSFAKLLTGPRGVGKSATLLHCIAWARENGWLTLVMPKCADLVSVYGVFISGTLTPVPIYRGSRIGENLFIQQQAAYDVLEKLVHSHEEELAKLPQRRQYSHDLYQAKSGATSTLAHILMRGLTEIELAADALYDLRMEFSLVEEYPVLIAIDEFNALYWPTSLWYDSKPVPAHQLVVPKAFRCVDHVPGDIEDDPDYKTPRNAKLNSNHLPRYGVLLAAQTRSIEAPSHQSQVTPCRFEEFKTKGLDHYPIKEYDYAEILSAVSWYKSRNLYYLGAPTHDEIGKLRVFTSGNPERVALHAMNNTTNYWYSDDFNE